MEAFAYEPADDRLFGTVGIALDHEAGTLTVSGNGLPRVEIRRSAGTPTESHVPIGTRDPERLVLIVDGADEPLRPAKGFLTRRSYRVEAGSPVRGHGYLLVPDSLGTSRLLRDGRLLGVLTSTGDGRVSAEWKVAESGERPEPHDAAIGYGLAAAFGTGAEPMWKLTLNALLELWP
ncbi:hypothetical protein [Streptomyces lavendofoliae]|uniref:hypothetical protein n=1 Tax=Streptomyces lavendofoliae TaxID=67314 RepID=UPI00300E8044